ncbi:hypothetical protein IE53DRAFT_385328 [Violaceomyces palustris]|uniref:Uncharacterized protein n=1 Tax=Violaceomyces palustris TaxID=1673888 RepID=A0ACD0P2K7_9BASI|nr:hypothetical protein IE53DRAFT_385328 [Violaceomyces palustris]
MKEAFSTPIRGWDPVRIISQIVALQCLHYLILSTLIPPLLSILSDGRALNFEGGATQVGMILDWRELAGRPTWDWDPLDRSFTSWAPLQESGHWGNQVGGGGGGGGSKGMNSKDKALVEAWKAGGVWLNDKDDHSHHPPPPSSNDPKTSEDVGPFVIGPDQVEKASSSDRKTSQQYPGQVGGVGKEKSNGSKDAELSNPTTPSNLPIESRMRIWEWGQTKDASRSWAIALAWSISGFVDVMILVFLVRRPTHMLDHTLTLHFVHLVITSYYASSLPTSLFWWILMLLHAGGCIVWAEQLAVKREMSTGFGHSLVGDGRGGLEAGQPSKSNISRNTTRKARLNRDRRDAEEEESRILFSNEEGEELDDPIEDDGGEKIEMSRLKASR